MNLSELNERCASAGIPYAYGEFIDTVNPPFLALRLQNSNNFVADNEVYKKKNVYNLYYVFENKDISIEDIIEDTILKDIVWSKNGETYIQSENVWETVYTFEL